MFLYSKVTLTLSVFARVLDYHCDSQRAPREVEHPHRLGLQMMQSVSPLYIPYLFKVDTLILVVNHISLLEDVHPE